MHAICQDLAAVCDELDQLVAGLNETQWQLTTPFFNWTIKDEIAHLAYFDETATLAIQDREAFSKKLERFLADLKPGESMFETINKIGRAKTNTQLLATWRDNRKVMIESLSRLDPKSRLPWYGPDMSAKSFATARLMETWAHGQDVFDTLKIRRKPALHLKHIAHLGYTTFAWSFLVRQLAIPTDPIRVELTGPTREIWSWGPEGAAQSVKGSADEFCLVVTQRRNIADTKLVVTGEAAKKWMQIAQAFAGLPENPPQPGQRVVKFGDE